MGRQQRYRLDHQGHEVVVTWQDPGWSSELLRPWTVTMTARAIDPDGAHDPDGADDDHVDAVTREVSVGARALLRVGGVTVVFRRTLLGRLGGCDVLDRPTEGQTDPSAENDHPNDEPAQTAGEDDDPVADRTERPPRPSELLPMEPTPGTLAARRHRWQQRHPRLYAARHVARAAIGMLGIGALLTALLKGLLPRIDWSWLPRFSIDLRDLIPDLPDLIPDLPLPDLPALPGWLVAFLAAAKWWTPVLLAVGVAAREVHVVRRRQARRLARDEGGTECEPSIPTGTPPDGVSSSTRQRSASPSEASSAPRPPRSAPGPE